jgi:hypothetical protein
VTRPLPSTDKCWKRRDEGQQKIAKREASFVDAQIPTHKTSQTRAARARELHEKEVNSTPRPIGKKGMHHAPPAMASAKEVKKKSGEKIQLQMITPTLQFISSSGQIDLHSS